MKSEDAMLSETNIEVMQKAREWGWQNPPRDILDVAAISGKLRSMPTGSACVALKIISEEALVKLLDQKPDDIRTLEFIAQSNPAVRPVIDKILALRTGYPYYESLRHFTLHPAMADRQVQLKCDKLDAVALTIEDNTPVIVFSSFNAMLLYRSAGREERLSDPIRTHVQLSPNAQLLLAVGKKDEVIQLLSLAKSNQPVVDRAAESLWYGSSAVEPHEKLLTRIIDYCQAKKITDIAFAPQRNGTTKLFMRRFGDMIKIPNLESLNAEDTTTVVNFAMSKSGANPSASAVRDPRDGQITYSSNAGDVYLRFSFIPLNHPGDDKNQISISVRLLPRTEQEIRLENLNIDPDARDIMSAVAKFPKGFILIVGGTNTGKSTTTAGMLGENVRYYGHKRKRLSLEKPIERFLPGLIQFNVPHHMETEDAFNSMLEAIMRHDPDLIWIGEILGPVTANVAIRSAISGHLVISTTHANNSILGYDKMLTMVPEDMRFQFIESLSLIVAQDMVKQVCPHCRKIEAPTEPEERLFKTYLEMNGLTMPIPEQVAHANHDHGAGEGCGYKDPKTEAECIDGFIKIRPINEVLLVTEEIKTSMIAMLGGKAIVNGENHRERIARGRKITLFDAAMKLVQTFDVELGDALL